MKEQIEWSRFWSEDAGSMELTRFLMIGDSIIDGSKGTVRQTLPKGFTVTSFITSKAVNDPFLLPEIELFTREEACEYPVIYFNNCLHDGQQTPEEYRANYHKTVLELRHRFPRSRIILGLATPFHSGIPADAQAHETPITLRGNLTLNEQNRKIVRFNEEVKAIGAELGLTVFDLYALTVDHPEWKVPDGVHFTPEGRAFIGTRIAESMTREYREQNDRKKAK